MLIRNGIFALVLGAVFAAGGVIRPADATETKTYLINGLASAVPFIGYGFANLQKKIPDAELFSYISPVEGSAIVQPKIMSEIRQAHKRNPDVEINLIGISYGANLITRMAAQLEREGIEVSYMGLLDGLPLAPVTRNVRRVDNFICTSVGCLRDKVRLARGNDLTIHNFFKYNSTHIALGNNADIHSRIMHQITTTDMNIATSGLDLSYTASTQ